MTDSTMTIKNRLKVWRNDKGDISRLDGPAIEWVDGTKAWCVNSKLHRTDGPAFEHCYGLKEWYLDGNLHRIDGPAVEWPDGAKEWFINGEELYESEFNERTKK